MNSLLELVPQASLSPSKSLLDRTPARYLRAGLTDFEIDIINVSFNLLQKDVMYVSTVIQLLWAQTLKCYSYFTDTNLFSLVECVKRVHYMYSFVRALLQLGYLEVVQIAKNSLHFLTNLRKMTEFSVHESCSLRIYELDLKFY